MVKLLYPSLADRAFQDMYALLNDHVGRLYEAIHRVSGLNVLVDSSKWPLYAIFLSNLGFDVRIIHLVRDSRGVVYSWKYKRKIDPSFHDAYYIVNVENTGKVSLEWDKSNLLTHMVAKLNKVKGYTLLKYEDLVADGNIMEVVLRRIGLKSLEEKQVNLQNHTVAGNPVRFNPELKLTPDIEYLQRMPAKDFFLTTAYTWPLLLLYRYRLTR